MAVALSIPRRYKWQHLPIERVAELVADDLDDAEKVGHDLLAEFAEFRKETRQGFARLYGAIGVAGLALIGNLAMMILRGG